MSENKCLRCRHGLVFKEDGWWTCPKCGLSSYLGKEAQKEGVVSILKKKFKKAKKAKTEIL